MRLIDAEFEENHYASMLLNPTPDVTEQDKHKARIIIDALRMAKTVEPKRGKWIQISKFPDRVEAYWVTCSACDRRIFGGGKFCPLCGADMREVTT